MTSCKGQLILSVLQSIHRLISIHCNYQSCSEFGQCFSPPKKGLLLKKWPMKKKLELN